jgi:hypothetical protein
MISGGKGEKALAHEFWGGQRLCSSRELPLSLHVGMEPVTDPLQVPRLALAAASDRRRQVVVHPDRLGGFLLQHKDGFFVGHGVQSAFWTIDQHLGRRDEASARRVLWDACDQGRLLDTQVLDLLLQLGRGHFRTAAGGKGDETAVSSGSLAEVAADHTSPHLGEDDAHGGRYRDLVGLPFEAWARAEPELFQAAARAAAVTWQLYPALAQAAAWVMLDSGFAGEAERYDIRPDAVKEFGHLSEVIQVQASVALAYLNRRGVRVDVERARALEAKYRAEVAQIAAALEKDYRDALTFDEDSGLRLTPKARTPSLTAEKLRSLLSRVVDQLRRQGQCIQIPFAEGKKKEICTGPTAWAEFAPLHPFLRLWTRLEQLKGRLEFLADVTAPVLHGEYALLKRTGRTSCEAPRLPGLPGLNLQQVPRDAECRRLFVAADGHKLFVGDYVAAELRTLAAVCLARYGRSGLAEVLAAGTDPHAHTAAMLLGMSLDGFMSLKAADPDQFEQRRQAAKALNFGIPGGLGAEALVAYARAKYGVTLTLEEAERFRQTIVTEVYAELSEYLADDGMAALAHNLGVSEGDVWAAFDHEGRRSPLAARGVANVIRGTSTAGEAYRAAVWEGLARLAGADNDLEPEFAGMIAGEQGCRRLHDRLYLRSAATLTGRVRAGVGYTQARNTPFQSLAADGAKRALWNLLYAGFDVVAFVHDEIVVELPAEDAEGKAKEAEAIMVRAMEEVMGQGVPAACKYVVADCWLKP